MATRRRGSKRKGWTLVVGILTIGSLNNISCLLQDMDCKGRLGTIPSRRRGSKREWKASAVRAVTIGSLNNISCLLQDMDCKGRLGTWPQGEVVRGRG